MKKKHIKLTFCPFSQPMSQFLHFFFTLSLFPCSFHLHGVLKMDALVSLPLVHPLDNSLRSSDVFYSHFFGCILQERISVCHQVSLIVIFEPFRVFLSAYTSALFLYEMNFTIIGILAWVSAVYRCPLLIFSNPFLH